MKDLTEILGFVEVDELLIRPIDAVLAVEVSTEFSNRSFSFTDFVLKRAQRFTRGLCYGEKLSELHPDIANEKKFPSIWQDSYEVCETLGSIQVRLYRFVNFNADWMFA